MKPYPYLNRVINLREEEEWEECLKEIVAFSTQIQMTIPEWAKDFLSYNDDKKNNLVSNWLIDANNFAINN